MSQHRLVDDSTLERLARAGLAGRGLFYAVLAIVAAQVVLGGSRGSGNASAQGAIEAISEQPFVRALLIALAVAFGAYAVWRGVQAFRGPHEDPDLPVWVTLVAFAFRASLLGTRGARSLGMVLYRAFLLAMVRHAEVRDLG